jgi:hypothetical protein
MNRDPAHARTASLLISLVPDPDSDADAADRLTRQLRAELTELDVESVDPVAAGTTPDGAKGPDPVTLGALLVAFSTSGGVFTGLIDTVRDWLGRQTGTHRITVTIDGDTIELEKASGEQQRALVDAYVRRHSAE